MAEGEIVRVEVDYLRTTTHYDRARNNLDRHGNYVVAGYLIGGA